MLHFSHQDRIASWTQSSPMRACQLAEGTPKLCLPGSEIQAGYCIHPTLMSVLGIWMLVRALDQQVLCPPSQLPSPHSWSFVHVSESFKILNMKYLPVFLISSSKLDAWYHFSDWQNEDNRWSSLGFMALKGAQLGEAHLNSRILSSAKSLLTRNVPRSYH